jgi:GLPGLI family protein
MNLRLTFYALAITLGSTAQQKEGTIVYQKRTNMHRTINNDQMKAMMPEFRDSKHQLLFSDSISVYKLIPEDEAPDPFSGGNGGGMVIRMGGGADAGELFKNFALAKSIQSNEIGGKNFLITDSIKQPGWKLTDETKKIAGYTCYKATMKMPAPVRRMMTISTNGNKTDSSSQATTPKIIDVAAWYTTSIPVPAGPDTYGQLPGAILEVDVDNGLSVITATEVKAAANKKELQEPKKGKVVTRAEYQKMLMEMMGGQGGGMMFRSREN